MKNDSGKKMNFTKKTLLVMGGMLVLILFVYLLFNLSYVATGISKVISILRPVFAGLIIAFLVNPMTNFFENLTDKTLKKVTKSDKKFEKTSIAVGITVSLIIFFAILFLIIYAIIPSFISSMKSFIDDFAKFWNNTVATVTNALEAGNLMLNDFMDKMPDDVSIPFNDFNIDNTIVSFLQNNISILATGVINSIFGISTFLIDLAVGLVVAVYALANKNAFKAQFKKILCAIFDKKIVRAVNDVARKSYQIFIGYINGKLINSLIMGVVCFIFVSITKMPYPMLLTIIIAVTDLIPIFGPYIGTIPCALLLLMVDPLKCLYFIIFIIILQAVEGNVISPKILGESTGIPAFWVMFAIVIGGGLFGVIGLFLGVPVFAVIYYIIKRYIEHLLSNKNLPRETSAYTIADYPEKANLEVSEDE